MLGTKESMSLLSQLKKIVMLGRKAGYFLIVACQRPDAKYFSDGIRDNFNFRVGLGRISELGYGMLFGPKLFTVATFSLEEVRATVA